MQKHTQHRFKIKLTPKLFTFDPDPEYAKRTNHQFPLKSCVNTIYS